MKHLGDITKISGYEAPTVDVIVGGSPCQDLSVAGKRAGLKHSDKGDDETTRSGLFMEQIRIIKEMRESDRRRLCGRGADVLIRPRYMVWENVPGAFSSNQGDDFRVVLEEVARISEEGVTIPRPKKGRWSTSGVIIGDNYSIAWRVFDAQYWGVPQRRKRICLVADFNGHTAPDIVFSPVEHYGSTEYIDSESSSRDIGEKCGCEVQSVSEGLSGNTEQSGEERQNTSSDAEGSTRASGIEFPAYTYQDREGKPGGGKGFLIQEDKSASLRTNNFQTIFQPIAYRKQGHPRNSEEGQGWEQAEKSDTLNAFDFSEARTPTVVVDENQTIFSAHGFGNYEKMDAVGSLMCGQNTTVRGDTPLVVSMDRETFNTGQNFSKTLGIHEDGIQPTLVARGPGGVCYRDQSTQSDMT